MSGAEHIAKNVEMVAGTLAGTLVSSSEPMKIVTEKVTVVLEELRTLLILTETHSGGLNEQLKAINIKIQQLDEFFRKTQDFNNYLQRTKKTLDDMEALQNTLDRC